MKNKKLTLVIVAVLLVIALIVSAVVQTGASSMGINFVNGSSMSFGTIPQLNSATIFTFHAIATITGTNPEYYPHIIYDLDDGSFTTGDIELKLLDGVSGSKISFLVEWDKGPSPVSRGLWYSSAYSFSTNVPYTIDVTYDMGSASNNPIMYINGVSVAVTEVIAPVAPAPTLTSDVLWMGGLSTLSNYSRTIIDDPRIYNRILSPSEIMAIYNGKGKDNITNGLIFCPMMSGAKGLLNFHGSVLTSANTIYDPCSHAVGTPSGSPIAIAEQLLIVK